MKSTALKGKLERHFARSVHVKHRPLPHSRAFVSFTFDDVPRSACVTGARILEDSGGRGTYYICGGFESDGKTNYFFDGADLRRLRSAGHEIGSHGFAHVDYQSISAREVQADVDRNDRYFESIGLPLATTFSYPFGCVNPAAKKVCAARFSACRGVQPAVNQRQVDLNLIKSLHLYSSLIDLTALTAEFQRLKREGGWLVFMTHAVTEQPDDCDLTPELLQAAVRLAVESNVPIMTVEGVVAELSGGRVA